MDTSNLITRLALAASVTLALILAGCGSTRTSTVTHMTTVDKPPPAVAPRGEARANHIASGCGVERWSVKTGTDPGASAVNASPQDTTVGALAAIKAPVDPTDRVAPVETTTWHLKATVYAIKQEADSDYHLAIKDDAGNTMIAESPAPSCAPGSAFASQIAQVRSAIDRACPSIGSSYANVSIPADLTGVGFFDRIHGQRGVAPNGIELHPITAITFPAGSSC